MYYICIANILTRMISSGMMYYMKEKSITLRISKEQYQALFEMSEYLGITVSRMAYILLFRATKMFNILDYKKEEEVNNG